MQWFEASISSFSLASEHQTVSSLSQIPIIPFFFFLTVKTEELYNIMIWEHINWMNLIHLTLTAQCQVLIKSVRQHRHRHRHVSLRPPIHNGLCSRFSTFNFLYRMRRLQPDANIRTKPFLRVAGKWKLCLSQLGFQLHFLNVWCQKKKGKKRNLTRYNLADCSYAHATNKLLSAPIVLHCGLHTPN